MRKNHYKKELTIKATQRKKGRSRNRKDILKIQSWLSLFAFQNPQSGTLTAIDGDFGPATETAVKNYQKVMGLNVDGVVDQKLFSQMCAPLKNAFERTLPGSRFRKLVVEVAENHLRNHPFELQIAGRTNCGPWVRSYMDGHDGSPWFWCMGFAQTILDQAASKSGKRLIDLMPLTYSCDTVGMVGLQKGLLYRYRAIRKNLSPIAPGDFFLIQKSRFDWTHTGIITRIIGDVFETIEGNTNNQGERNGIAVFKRTRNFRQSKMDVFSIAPLAEK